MLKAVVIVLLTFASTGWTEQLDEARALLDSDQVEQARAILENAVNDERMRGDALVMLTELYNSTGQWQHAVEFGEQAVKALPESSTAHSNYAIALRLKMLNVSKVKALFILKTYRKLFTRAIELDPANVDARTEQISYLLGAPGVVGGDKDEARRLTKELEKYDWKLARRMAAAIELADDRPEMAVTIYEEIVEKHPQDMESRLSLGFFLQQQERYREADEHFILVSQGDDPGLSLAARYQRARSRVVGRYEQEKAVKLLQAYIADVDESISGIPPKSAAYWRMGLALEQLARSEEARAAYKRALELDPDSDEARKAIKALG